MSKPSPWEEPRVRLVEIRLLPRRVAAPQVHSARDVARLLHELIGDADREHFVAVYLDGRHRATHVHVVSVGHLLGALVHPREVFKGALLSNAAALVVGHNHPSGELLPSSEDSAVTERLKAAGELLGIELLDALIIGADRRYYSLAEGAEAAL